MKKAFILLCCFIVLIALTPFVLQGVKQQVKKDLASPVMPPSAAPTITYKVPKEERESLFVPFWTIDSETLNARPYGKLIYFGVAANGSGINTNEGGYINLKRFTSQVSSEKDMYLTVRMLDPQVNSQMLKSKALQEQIITDTVTIAGQHGFSGIVLDLELSALPLDKVVSQISSFVSDFSKAAKIRDLRFGIAAYGDTFYRVRPFDMKQIAPSVDEVFIMAYDFHKSGGGTPGPNFPYKESETYGYDFQRMIGDFQQVIPSEKLTVIFGMFGYDWIVDDKGKAVSPGRPVTLFQAETLSKRSEVTTKRNDVSAEKMLMYKDTEGKDHVVWYEDKESMLKKKEFLKTRGIGSYSFWAHSYF